jgi:hypothetical protein
MSKKRIISESINIRINVGNFQHIEIIKQAQEEISYESEEDRIEQEEALTSDLITSVVRSMRSVPEKLGKGVANAQEVEESIAKAIPAWLNEKVPNIADNPKKKLIQVSAEQKAKVDEVDDIFDVEETPVEKPAVKKEVKEEEKAVVDSDSPITEDADDLFEEEETPAKSEVIEETPVVEAEVKETPVVKTEVKETPVVEEAPEVEVNIPQETEKKEQKVEVMSDSFDELFGDDDDDLFDL